VHYWIKHIRKLQISLRSSGR